MLHGWIPLSSSSLDLAQEARLRWPVLCGGSGGGKPSCSVTNFSCATILDCRRRSDRLLLTQLWWRPTRGRANYTSARDTRWFMKNNRDFELMEHIVCQLSVSDVMIYMSSIEKRTYNSKYVVSTQWLPRITQIIQWTYSEIANHSQYARFKILTLRQLITEGCKTVSR